jgi:hypothetical protein
MPVSHWTPADSAAAQEIWAEYQNRHDLSAKEGHTAGIDPASGRVWIGESMEDVVDQRDADECDSPLFFVRIGSPTYYRKGGHR